MGKNSVEKTKKILQVIFLLHLYLMCLYTETSKKKLFSILEKSGTWKSMVLALLQIRRGKRELI